MNKQDKIKIIKHGLAMLQLWSNVIKEAEEAAGRPDWRKGMSTSWHKREVRQAHQDAMNSLIHLGLIQSFNVTDIKIQIDGEWFGHDDVPKRQFVPTNRG